MIYCEERVEFVSKFETAKSLQNNYQFNKAIKLLDTIENRDNKYYRLLAQCYYQDLKRSTKERFDKAFKILDNIKDDTNPQETTRLKGAIYKRKYQYNKDIKDLYKAIQYYELAAENVIEDNGYGAGNTVFLYYLLLNVLGNNINKEIKKSYLSKIFQIQQEHLGYLEQLNEKKEGKLYYWIYASMSALYLSRGNFLKAKEYMEEYYDAYLTQEKKSKYDTLDRELYITIKQTIELFNILPMNKQEKNLKDILSTFENAKKPRVKNMNNSLEKGKVGLALSGGGFRASLFHIGTLLHLAELDILRHIQVISTVSGGSIIGMYYYLSLKFMLETKENGKLKKQDYIDLVEDIRKEFSIAIRDNNIRMLAFQKKPKENLTEKLGALYQEKLYNPIFGDSTPITNMSELKIEPKIGNENKTDFIPEFHNFELENKVPRIIVNATLLNNGHNWQFTAEGMGENKYLVDKSIEKNDIYEFEYYKKIEGLTKDDYLDKDISIARAIASSSAVPVLFDPIELKEFDYEEENIVRLSDGGLYDNLGLSSLLADECTHIIVSDGSKQLQTDNNPSIFRLDVSSRTTDVLMHRTRDGEYKMAKNLQERGIIEGLAIVHLNGENSSIDNELQKKLASIRTDLDSFHDLESSALIYGGYKVCTSIFEEKSNKDSWEKFDLGTKNNINFKQFEDRFTEDKIAILRILEMSSRVLFKVPPSFIWIFILTLVSIGLYLNEYKSIAIVIALLFVIYFLPIKRALKTFFSTVISPIFIIPISFFYRKTLSKLYICWGRISEKA